MFFDTKSHHERKQSREDMLEKATNIRKRLFSSLSMLPSIIKSKVDELCTALQEQEDTGSVFRCAKLAHSAIKELPNDAVLSDLMLSADVIFSTLCSAASNVMKGKVIDALIVDEAAAATEPDLYIPFHLKPSRLLVVGDPKQLPATVLSDRAKKLGLDISLQERLMNQCGYSFTRLDTQYRMAPEISKFPARRFYQNMIGNGENVMKPTYGKISPSRLFDGIPYAFLQIDGREENDKGGSKFNLDEANAVVDLVRKLVDRRNRITYSSDRLRIITFYTAQVLLLQKMLSRNGLKDVLVATVDSSQGCEADIVIVSLVRSSFAGFLKDDRRMNVALTRSRHQLVCVGNVRRYPDMASAYTLHYLAEDVRNRNVIVVHPPSAKRIKT
jgi:superfamily I DNA and/or RNA helicase